MSPSSDHHGRIVIAGGGTAGHVLPGIAVATALVERGHPAGDIVFVGSARGLEAKLVPEAGFEVVLLPGRGIQRRLSRQNIAAIWGLVRAFVSMIGWVRRRRPAAVLTLGGYASVAASLAAVLWRVPIVVTEQNARAGAANRLIGRFARRCAVPVAGTDLPRAVVTGNPVRPMIAAVSAREADGSDVREARREASRQELGIPADRRVVAAFAGSLGATRINEAVVDLAQRWAGRGDVWIHHIVGSRDAESLRVPSLPPGGLHLHTVTYEERMDLVLAAADVAVCRSGGTTVAELAVVGVAAILVPLPIAPRDHQRANAVALVEAGAAVVIDDSALDCDRLELELERVLEGDRAREMCAAAGGLGRPDAAAKVAGLIEEVAR
ncbi:MAG: UDP-N-acetylglucosamine--N-acetylmuramyl-(pentapeptide) pyrophosphoryl-undecaprenol N-acetylglucosamine transferase [Microthrixaceae bacterium]|nr:UDP-N-acetylglucosamine--N-acetylmuramyl-(pentapeptide) pyrophosphoryl-undecaprenol N-acetylglucosamine transferase [Microthrixaceae bacterium]